MPLQRLLARLFGGGREPPSIPHGHRAGGGRDDVWAYLDPFDELQLNFAREILGPYIECNKVGEKQMRSDVPLPIAQDIARHIATTIAGLPTRCQAFRISLGQLRPGPGTVTLHQLGLDLMDAWYQEISAYHDAATQVAASGFSEPDVLDALANRIEDTTARRTESLKQLVEVRSEYPRR